MKKHPATRMLSAFIAAISLFAITIFAEACQKNTTSTGDSKITYTDIDPDTAILTFQTDTFQLDLNKDGVADFEFDRSREVTCNDALMGTSAYDIKISLRPLNANCAIMTSSSTVLFDSAVLISSDSLWTTTSAVLLNARTSANGHCVTTPSVLNGDLLNNSDRFVGLRITDGNKTYYGWADLLSSYTLTPNPNAHLSFDSKLILRSYAFNSTANQPVKTGQVR